jgi:hypothetical protein
MMGKTKLVWSHVELSLMNQHKIVSNGLLIGVHVNVDGLCWHRERPKVQCYNSAPTKP